MVSLIDSKLVCHRHDVHRLDLIGSATNPSIFDPARSDVDFVVDFPAGTDLGPWLARYFDVKADLESLLGRSVDLIMESAIRNAIFRREVECSRQVIYAAEDSEAA